MTRNIPGIIEINREYHRKRAMNRAAFDRDREPEFSCERDETLGGIYRERQFYDDFASPFLERPVSVETAVRNSEGRFPFLEKLLSRPGILLGDNIVHDPIDAGDLDRETDEELPQIRAGCIFRLKNSTAR